MPKLVDAPEGMPSFRLPLSGFEEKEYQTESKRNETFGNVIFSPNMIQETWTLRQETKEEATR